MIINNITLKQLAEFRRYSERRKRTFANQVQLPKTPRPSDGGGDYWIPCTSAIANAFKEKNNQPITAKIDQLADDMKTAKFANTQIMYKRNLEILQTYEHFDLSPWAPTASLTFLQRPKVILTIKNVPVKITSHHVFTFKDQGQQMIGGIWFVVWLDGFKVSDLGMYTEALKEYLVAVYGPSYHVATNYCLTIDVVIQKSTSYEQVVNKSVPSALIPTLDELNKLVGP